MEEEADGGAEGGAGSGGGGGGGCGWCGGEEEGGDGGEGGDDGDVEGHGGDGGGVWAEEGVDQLAQGAAEGVGEGGDRGSRDTATRGEPEFREVGWGGENEGLGEADEDLPEHDDAVSRWRGSRTAVSDPITAEDEEGGGDEGAAWTAGIECVDRGW